MAERKILSREKPNLTLLRASKFDGELKNVLCDKCHKILFQSFSDVHMLVEGHPDTETNPSLLDASTIILQCHGNLIIEKNGERINTRCSARYFVT